MNIDSVYLNPFCHKLEISSTCDKIRTILFTIFVLPTRIFLIAALLVIAWCLACVGLYGLSEEDLSRHPLQGWRRTIREWICIFGKSAYNAGGMRIRVKGRQARREEAPILVIAPHSTFLDAAIVYITGFPTIIVRTESGINPWLGKLINFTQPVYVWRDDPNSRQKSIQEIINRTKSDQDWPQILIFPEGTCTNRSCLITFKQGAFYPGVPVQPVLLRYPNKMDTVTWTWEGPGALKLLWLTLTQTHSNCEIEFLPVYKPNEAEKLDPKLYANNVRNLMAQALGIPTSEYSYEDCKLVKKARHLQLPPSSLLMQTQKLRIRMGIAQRKPEQKFLQNEGAWNEERWVKKEEFAQMLAVSADHDLDELFRLFARKGEDLTDMRKYLLTLKLFDEAGSKSDIVAKAFQAFGGKMTEDSFKFVLCSTGCINEEQANRIFNKAKAKNERSVDSGEGYGYGMQQP